MPTLESVQPYVGVTSTTLTGARDNGKLRNNEKNDGEQLINKEMWLSMWLRRIVGQRFWIGVPGRLQDGRCHDVIARTAKR